MITTVAGRRSLALLFLSILATGVASGQAPALKSLPLHSNVAIRLSDGSLVYGSLERQDADSVVVVGAGGRHAYPTAAIRDLRAAGVARVQADGTTEFWYPNANATRLFFGPTGRTLNAGEGYFADHEVIIASASVGITDRVQFGAGTFIIPNSDFWFVMPKLGIIRSQDVNISAGALYGGIRDDRGGIGYVVGTFGSTDRSFTAGIGRGISGAKVEGEPVFMLGGEARVSRRAALVTENYFGAGTGEGLLMYGVRFLGERFTVDLAMMNSARDPVFPGMPYVDFVIKW
jgi:hypothetical protein